MNKILIAFVLFLSYFFSISYAQTDEYIFEPECLPHTIGEFNFLRNLAITQKTVELTSLIQQDTRPTPFIERQEMIYYSSDTVVVKLLVELMRMYDVHSKSELDKMSGRVPGLVVFPLTSDQALVTMFIDKNENRIFLKSMRFDIAYTDETFKEAKEQLQFEIKK